TAARAARPARSPGAAGSRTPMTTRQSCRRLLTHNVLELADGTVDEHLRRAVRAAHRPRDLAVVHAEREAHDQRLAAILRQLIDALEDALQLVAPLDEVLGRVRGRECTGVVDRGLRLARAVAVQVRREVVRDA